MVAPQGCGQGPVKLSRKRLDLLMVLDSGAAISPWYPALSQGLAAFLEDEGSHGTGVGLLRFGESCNVQDYLSPTVPIETLPENLASLKQAIPEGALSTTSTLPALNAAMQYAQRWANDHAQARVATVLLTMGAPGMCDGVPNYDEEAARVVRAAFTSSPSISTHVVGVGALQILGALAKAGGTDAHVLSTLSTKEEALAALQSVRELARPCELELPSGAPLSDDAQVVISSTDGRKAMWAIERGDASCPQPSGFVLRREAGAPRLLACPQTCAGLRADDTFELTRACSP
jgi:hypothetical protein